MAEALPEITNHPRKRQRNEKEWNRAKEKRRRNSGENKQARIGCAHAPHSYCHAALLTEEDIFGIFDRMYCDGDKVRQDSFIQGHIILVPVKRRRGGNAQPQRERNYEAEYMLTRESGERIRVCAPTFQSILCVGKKRIANIAKFMWEHNSPRPERRGGKRQQQGYADLKQRVIDHIQTFTCVSSHYGRNKTPHRKYLPSTLSVQRMFELFREQYMGDMNVTYTFYYNIFMTQFNLGFGSPKTDVCSYCKGHETALKNETDEDKRKVLVTELLVHRMRAKRFYKMLADKEDPTTLVISFDLMQNQPLPKSSIGEAYYARQLWLYILGIIEHRASGDPTIPTEQSKDDVNFYTWGEEAMGRGANQVASALKDFLDRRLSADRNIRKVILYSDSCVGQNKNFAVLGLLNMLSTKYNVEMEHRFPVRGHSYMPADRAFGRVEKKLRQIEEIVLPEQYLEVFALVGHVHVHGLHWNAFMIKEAVDSAIRRPAPFKITDAKILKVSPTSQVTFCSYYSAPGTEYSLLKRGKRWSTIEPQRLEPQNCVKAAKKRDVENLLRSLGYNIITDMQLPPCGPLTIPQRVLQFYRLVCERENDMDIDSDGDDEGTVNIYED